MILTRIFQAVSILFFFKSDTLCVFVETHMWEQEPANVR